MNSKFIMCRLFCRALHWCLRRDFLFCSLNSFFFLLKLSYVHFDATAMAWNSVALWKWNECNSYAEKRKFLIFMPFFFFYCILMRPIKLWDLLGSHRKLTYLKRIIHFSSHAGGQHSKKLRLLRMGDASSFGQRHQQRKAIIFRNQKSSSWIKFGKKLGN